MALCACSPERRWIDPGQPATAPASLHDPRADRYAVNVYDLSIGQRMFRWYGCGDCHARGAKGVPDLSDRQWRHGGSVPEIYASIAGRHPDGACIPPELAWAIAGYVATMPGTPAPKAARQDAALQGEPHGAAWSGALP